MYITAPPPKTRLVEDYDITFTNGTILPLTIDREAGDTVDFDQHPTVVIVHLAEKPHPTNPDTVLSKEEYTIFTAHILHINKRFREVEDNPIEQKEQWKLTIQEISKTVQ